VRSAVVDLSGTALALRSLDVVEMWAPVGQGEGR
jgi:hypothetical protein